MPAPRSRDREQILGYRLIERLGAGGFGEVWKAEAPGGLLKAVKFVYGQMDGKQANQEVKALERIKEVRHPFVLSLERVEIVDGQLIIVSELADKTLLDRFEECRAAGGHGIPRGELLRYLADAAEAIDHLTSQFRLQHLDIKPSNLFLLGGHLKVGDFGLVREISLHAGVSIGGLSPAYAAPESFTGECSLYSDQYALAIVYQEMLTGTRPFRGRTALQLSEQHVRARPNLTALADGEREVLGRALSKNPNDRYPACGEMIRGLLGVQVSDQPSLRSDKSRDAVPGPGPRSEPQREPEPEHRRDAAPELEPVEAPAHGFDDTSEFQDPECTAPEQLLHSCNATNLGLESLALATLKSQFSPVSPGLARPLGSSAAGESRPDSLPEPTVFVGIGGIAGSTLCAIKRLFEMRLEAPTDKSPLNWLLLETDRAALQRFQRPDLEGKLKTEETVLLPLYGANHYRSRLKQLLCWLDRHWVFRIPRSRSTKGIRPLGRLALLDCAEEVQAALRKSIKGARALIKDQQKLQRLQVIVIASISGGTGGGCLADVGYLVRRILREEGLESASIAGVLDGAASVRKEEEELARANAYVTLMELRHFHAPGCHFPGVKALDLSPVEGGAALFDQVFLTDFGKIASDDDVESGSRLLAEYIYLKRGTPYGRSQASVPKPGGGAGAETILRSFRLDRLGFPRAELCRLIAREVCQRMLGRWLHGMPNVVESARPEVTTGAPAPASGNGSPRLDLYSAMGLDEENFHELFLERVERSSGSDPLKVFERQTRELLAGRNREGPGPAFSQFLDELDVRFGDGAGGPADPHRVSQFERKLRDEFKHDQLELERKLESSVRGVVEDPSARLKPAREALERFSVKLVEQIDATPNQIRAMRVSRAGIRDRQAGGASFARATLPGLLKPLHREESPRGADICEYGHLWIRETSLRIRSEILAALLARAAQVEEELNRMHQAIEHARRLFQGKLPRFAEYQRGAIGRTQEILPVTAGPPDEIRDLLTAAFWSDRRLAGFEAGFQEEVLSPHGGLTGVLSRESRNQTEVFENDLFHRVASVVGRWLEGRDAASILLDRSGSLGAAIATLDRSLAPLIAGLAGRPGQRLVVATPGSPAGRSLREGLASAVSEPSVPHCVTIADDVVLCLEIENQSFTSVAAEMVAARPWISELAPKLVSRIDVAWRGLNNSLHPEEPSAKR